MPAKCSILLLASLVSCLAAPPVLAQDVVEVLKDAQATNRNAWKRGRAAFRLEITNKERAGVATLEGDLRWNESDMIIRYKISDPEGVRFKDRALFLGKEWNYITRDSKTVITYVANNNVLNERRPTPNAFEPLYDLSLLTTFAQCCPPYGVQGRPWSDLIGPSASLPEVFQSSKFEHSTLPNGDRVQTRVDEDGHRLVVTFSAMDNLAIRSAISYDSRGTLLDENEYSYSKSADGTVIPKSVTSVTRSKDLKKATTFRYTFAEVQLPGDVSTGDFARDAVLARIDRETSRGKRPQVKTDLPVDDASLDAQAKSLRENGSARPKP